MAATYLDKILAAQKAGPLAPLVEPGRETGLLRMLPTAPWGERIQPGSEGSDLRHRLVMSNYRSAWIQALLPEVPPAKALRFFALSSDDRYTASDPWRDQSGPLAGLRFTGDQGPDAARIIFAADAAGFPVHPQSIDHARRQVGLAPLGAETPDQRPEVDAGLVARLRRFRELLEAKPKERTPKRAKGEAAGPTEAEFDQLLARAYEQAIWVPWGRPAEKDDAERLGMPRDGVDMEGWYAAERSAWLSALQHSEKALAYLRKKPEKRRELAAKVVFPSDNLPEVVLAAAALRFNVDPWIHAEAERVRDQWLSREALRPSEFPWADRLQSWIKRLGRFQRSLGPVRESSRLRNDYSAPDKAGKDAPPTIRARRMAEQRVKIAADSIAELRRVDVERVLRESPARERAAVAGVLRHERADLVDEVSAVLQELQAETTAPPPAPERTMAAGRADYEERRESRIERLREQSDRRHEEAAAFQERSRERLDRIPMGQPILVGHHSERRHRSDIDKSHRDMHRAIEASDEAARLARAADAAEEGRAISSDDPDAIAKLEARIAEIEAQRERLREIQKAARSKSPAEALAQLGVKPARIAELLAKDMGGNTIGVRSFEFTNRAAEVRRLRQRVDDLKQRAATAKPADHVRGAARAVWDDSTNRVAVILPFVPKGEERTRRTAVMRRAGFVWSPSQEQWQRKASTQAWYQATQAVDELAGSEPAPATPPATESTATAPAVRWLVVKAYPENNHPLRTAALPDLAAARALFEAWAGEDRRVELLAVPTSFGPEVQAALAAAAAKSADPPVQVQEVRNADGEPYQWVLLQASEHPAKGTRMILDGSRIAEQPDGGRPQFWPSLRTLMAAVPTDGATVTVPWTPVLLEVVASNEGRRVTRSERLADLDTARGERRHELGTGPAPDGIDYTDGGVDVFGINRLSEAERTILEQLAQADDALGRRGTWHDMPTNGRPGRFNPPASFQNLVERGLVEEERRGRGGPDRVRLTPSGIRVASRIMERRNMAQPLRAPEPAQREAVDDSDPLFSARKQIEGMNLSDEVRAELLGDWRGFDAHYSHGAMRAHAADSLLKRAAAAVSADPFAGVIAEIESGGEMTDHVKRRIKALVRELSEVMLPVSDADRDMSPATRAKAIDPNAEELLRAGLGDGWSSRPGAWVDADRQVARWIKAAAALGRAEEIEAELAGLQPRRTDDAFERRERGEWERLGREARAAGRPRSPSVDPELDKRLKAFPWGYVSPQYRARLRHDRGLRLAAFFRGWDGQAPGTAPVAPGSTAPAGSTSPAGSTASRAATNLPAGQGRVQARDHWLLYADPAAPVVAIKGPAPGPGRRQEAVAKIMDAGGFVWNGKLFRYEHRHAADAADAAWTAGEQVLVQLAPEQSWYVPEEKVLRHVATISHAASNWGGPGGPRQPPRRVKRDEGKMAGTGRGNGQEKAPGRTKRESTSRINLADLVDAGRRAGLLYESPAAPWGARQIIALSGLSDPPIRWLFGDASMSDIIDHTPNIRGAWIEALVRGTTTAVRFLEKPLPAQLAISEAANPEYRFALNDLGQATKAKSKKPSTKTKAELDAYPAPDFVRVVVAAKAAGFNVNTDALFKAMRAGKAEATDETLPEPEAALVARLQEFRRMLLGQVANPADPHCESASMAALADDAATRITENLALDAASLECLRRRVLSTGAVGLRLPAALSGTGRHESRQAARLLAGFGLQVEPEELRRHWLLAYKAVDPSGAWLATGNGNTDGLSSVAREAARWNEWEDWRRGAIAAFDRVRRRMSTEEQGPGWSAVLARMNLLYVLGIPVHEVADIDATVRRWLPVDARALPPVVPVSPVGAVDTVDPSAVAANMRSEPVPDMVIEQVAEYPTAELAAEVLPGILGQEECIGGRCVAGGEGRPSRIQAFFPDRPGDLMEGERRVDAVAAARVLGETPATPADDTADRELKAKDAAAAAAQAKAAASERKHQAAAERARAAKDKREKAELDKAAKAAAKKAKADRAAQVKAEREALAAREGRKARGLCAAREKERATRRLAQKLEREELRLVRQHADLKAKLDAARAPCKGKCTGKKKSLLCKGPPRLREIAKLLQETQQRHATAAERHKRAAYALRALGAEAPEITAPAYPKRRDGAPRRASCGTACYIQIAGGRCGAEATILLPSSQGAPRSVTTRYCLIDADALVTSHDPMTFAVDPRYPEGTQERRYDRDQAEQLKIINIAQNPRPEVVFNTSATPLEGTPVATIEGIVLGGNGRTMGIKRAYASGSTVYSDYLARVAGEFGFTAAQIRKFAKPIVVRTVDLPRSEWVRYVRDLNQGLTQAMDATAEAVSFARQMSKEAITAFADGLGGGDQDLADYFRSRASMPFIHELERAGVITAQNRGRLTDVGGLLSEEGRALVVRQLSAAILPNADLLDSLGQQLRQTLARSAPYWIAAAGQGGDWDVRPPLDRAIRDWSAVRAQDTDRRAYTLKEYFAQASLFAAPHSHNHPMALRLLVLLDRLGHKPAQFAKVARIFSSEAELATGRQATLLTPKTPTQALDDGARSVGLDLAALTEELMT